jgi:hypothetical protein
MSPPQRRHTWTWAAEAHPHEDACELSALASRSVATDIWRLGAAAEAAGLRNGTSVLRGLKNRTVRAKRPKSQRCGVVCVRSASCVDVKAEPGAAVSLPKQTFEVRLCGGTGAVHYG